MTPGSDYGHDDSRLRDKDADEPFDDVVFKSGKVSLRGKVRKIEIPENVS